MSNEWQDIPRDPVTDDETIEEMFDMDTSDWSKYDWIIVLLLAVLGWTVVLTCGYVVWEILR